MDRLEEEGDMDYLRGTKSMRRWHTEDRDGGGFFEMEPSMQNEMEGNGESGLRRSLRQSSYGVGEESGNHEFFFWTRGSREDFWEKKE